jgi:hypothetical protein
MIRTIAERIFISEPTYPYIFDALAKALELVMLQEVPPPYKVSCDIIDNILVVVAIPDYDYEKMVIASLPENSDHYDAISDALIYMIPAIYMESKSEDLPDDGMTLLEGGTWMGARVYISKTALNDINRENQINLN